MHSFQPNDKKNLKNITGNFSVIGLGWKFNASIKWKQKQKTSDSMHLFPHLYLKTLLNICVVAFISQSSEEPLWKV